MNDEYMNTGLPVVPLTTDSPFFVPAQAACEVAKFVAQHGTRSNPRGMPVLELMWADFSILTPEAVPFTLLNRELNPRYGALEICSLLSGMPVDAHQRHRAQGFLPFQDTGIQRGNYGVRIRNQLRDFVTKLGYDDQFSRQAVMTIYDGNCDLSDVSRDVPCTLAVQGLIRDGIFYMRTTMRSNDVYLGLPYDLMQFCTLQSSLAQILDVVPGFYRHSVGSLHMYTQDAEKVAALDYDDDNEPDVLWAIPENLSDPLDRLQYITTFCQDALYGQLTRQPESDFEQWLVESL